MEERKDAHTHTHTYTRCWLRVDHEWRLPRLWNFNMKQQYYSLNWTCFFGYGHGHIASLWIIHARNLSSHQPSYAPLPVAIVSRLSSWSQHVKHKAHQIIRHCNRFARWNFSSSFFSYRLRIIFSPFSHSGMVYGAVYISMQHFLSSDDSFLPSIEKRKYSNIDKIVYE